jgi:hypothetical protein
MHSWNLKLKLEFRTQRDKKYLLLSHPNVRLDSILVKPSKKVSLLSNATRPLDRELIFSFFLCFPKPSIPRKRSCARAARWFVFKPKIPFGYILEGLRTENPGIFYGDLEYFTVIWKYIFYGHLVMVW